MNYSNSQTGDSVCVDQCHRLLRLLPIETDAMYPLSAEVYICLLIPIKLVLTTVMQAFSDVACRNPIK